MDFFFEFVFFRHPIKAEVSLWQVLLVDQFWKIKNFNFWKFFWSHSVVFNSFDLGRLLNFIFFEVFAWCCFRYKTWQRNQKQKLYNSWQLCCTHLHMVLPLLLVSPRHFILNYQIRIESINVLKLLNNLKKDEVVSFETLKNWKNIFFLTFWL